MSGKLGATSPSTWWLLGHTCRNATWGWSYLRVKQKQTKFAPGILRCISQKMIFFLPWAIFWYLLANQAHKWKPAPFISSCVHLLLLDHKPLKGGNHILLSFYNPKQQEDWLKGSWLVWQHCAWCEISLQAALLLKKCFISTLFISFTLLTASTKGIWFGATYIDGK